MMKGDIYLSPEPAANAFLKENPFGLLMGMLLDQQIPMERAFSAPYLLNARLKTHFDKVLSAANLASLGEDQMTALFSEKPALHRFPKAMAAKCHLLAERVVTDYHNDAAALWEGADSAEALLSALESLNGFGIDKSKIFIALLGKRFNAAPVGWERVSDPFGRADEVRSVADASSPEALEEIRLFKAKMKAMTKASS
ncbi:HhH-GPD-type base excision DNA repair protein [Ferrimicrobium acidiphilum]|uniref:HhH-GPD-type base excision DNA repair protein n=1 Tax=Ferrimicrobium acidiphilum TaxID=121039 RepID=UPI0023EF6AC1|nr:HhH-GPD-type base excision DNA repair protein [Ferrimicrobium acidiphilum]